MNVYAFIQDYIFMSCVIKNYMSDYIFPTELIHLIMIYYIHSYRHLLSSGDDYSFLYQDNILQSWGSNIYAQLCIDKSIKKTTGTMRHIPNLYMIACGSLHTVFVSKYVYSVGNNIKGQVGQFINLNITTPERVKVDGLVLAVGCGSFHTVIVTDKHVYCMGSNDYKQCGGTVDFYEPTILDTLSIKNIINVSCGGFHSFLMTDNHAYSIGGNRYYQLGLAHNNDINQLEKINLSNIIQISAGLSHSMFLCKNGDLYGSGKNSNGQLGLGNFDPCHKLTKVMSNVMMVRTGESFTIVLTKDGLYSFGKNSMAQLCLDHYDDCCLPQKINLEKVVSFTCGKNFTIINTRNGLYGQGANDKKQLGNCKKIN